LDKKKFSFNLLLSKKFIGDDKMEPTQNPVSTFSLIDYRISKFKDAYKNIRRYEKYESNKNEYEGILIDFNNHIQLINQENPEQSINPEWKSLRKKIAQLAYNKAPDQQIFSLLFYSVITVVNTIDSEIKKEQAKHKKSKESIPVKLLKIGSIAVKLKSCFPDQIEILQSSMDKLIQKNLFNEQQKNQFHNYMKQLN
jgi:hypothetical protein